MRNTKSCTDLLTFVGPTHGHVVGVPCGPCVEGDLWYQVGAFLEAVETNTATRQTLNSCSLGGCTNKHNLLWILSTAAVIMTKPFLGVEAEIDIEIVAFTTEAS